MKIKVEKAFKFKPFSVKQKKVLSWWTPNSPVRDYDGIIAHGSIRSGKSASMSLSFVLWAMSTYNDECFGMAGKTIGAFRRNVLRPLKKMLKGRGFHTEEKRSESLFIVRKNGVENWFYIFGGTNEASQDLVQGVTLAGFYFDEVALMPESFVSQAIGRCSIEGAKLWFNCNPEAPTHWFKIDWIDEAKNKRLLVLHFMMQDNLSLDEKTRSRYERYFQGVFYERFILGRWVRAEGLIFDMFDKNKHIVPTKRRRYEKYYVSVDYGIQNATTFGLWGLYQGTWYKVKEYYYSGREEQRQKTDSEFADDFERFVKGLNIVEVIMDPSATSFRVELRRRGFKVRKAKNDVVDGIKYMQACLSDGKILYNDCCKETVREFYSYSWDPKAADRGKDEPIKENDHCMDGDRYFCATVLKRSSGAHYVFSGGRYY